MCFDKSQLQSAFIRFIHVIIMFQLSFYQVLILIF